MRRFSSARQTQLERETEAVEFAVMMVLRKPEGEITERLWQMVYRDRTHYLYGAALALGISERTAKRYNWFFIKMIAIAMGYESLF